MTEVSEEFIDEAMRFITRPSIEAVLSAKHLLREPGHPDPKVPYSKPRILTEEEVKAMYGMEG